MAKILFVQNYNDELIGIASIASYINQKHQVGVIFGSHQNIIEKYKSFKPDVVGICALTKDHSWVLSLAARIKSIGKNSIILLGGPHPTFYPEIIADKYVDAICVGEGEKPVLNLLNRIEDDKEYIDIPSIWIKKDNKLYKNGNQPLLNSEEIPIRDVTLYKSFSNISESEILTVMSSRGCPFNCYFCCEYQLQKMYGANNFRLRKVEDVIKEIELLRKNRDIQIIKFQDEVFGINKKWLQDFVRQYKKRINLPFYSLLKCNYISENIIEQLIEAGCFRVGIGIESGDEYIRNKVLNKNLSDATIKKGVEILKKKKISFHTFNMFGLPQENFKLALKTVDLNVRLKPDIVWSAIFQPYPGTKFFSDKVRHDILSPRFNRFKVSHSYSKDSVKIYRLQKLFMLTVKIPIVKCILPVLARLPLGWLYDRLSQLMWSFFYDRELKKGI